jgi:hypothetical protein
LSTQRFKATVASSGTRTYVVIPFDPDEVWGVKDRHYVTGSIDGRKIRVCLVSEGTTVLLPIGPAWLRDNLVDTAADVEVVLGVDGPQSDTLTSDIAAALENEPHAEMFFASLAPFYRNNYIRWIESARRQETRSARISEMVGLLVARRKQR